MVVDLGGGEYEYDNPDQPFVLGGAWRNVRYISGGRDRQVASELDALLSRLKEPAPGEHRVPWLLIDASFASSRTNYWKDEAFGDEREVRAAWNVNPTWKFLKYRSHRFGLVPYIEVAQSDDGEEYVRCGTPTRLPIERVMIGPTPMYREVERALTSFLGDSGYGHVIVDHSPTPYR